VTLAGHAGGPPIDGEVSDAALVDAVESAMDAAGFETAHIVGNSLDGVGHCPQLDVPTEAAELMLGFTTG
jgi:hypothetical protein